MDNLISVITSDIIGSSQLSEPELKVLQQGISLFPDLCKKQFPEICTDLFTSFTNYRGDEYQIVLNKPEYGFRIAILLRLFVFMRTPYGELNDSNKNNFKNEWKQQLNKKMLYDIRSSVGIGSKSDVLEDNGQAFVLSGHGLDALKSQKRAFSIDTEWKDSKINDILKLNMEIIERYMSRWKPVHGRIAAYYMMNVPRDVIMKKTHVSSSAVSQAIAATNVDFIKRIIESMEDIIRAKINNACSL